MSVQRQQQQMGPVICTISVGLAVVTYLVAFSSSGSVTIDDRCVPRQVAPIQGGTTTGDFGLPIADRRSRPTKYPAPGPAGIEAISTALIPDPVDEWRAGRGGFPYDFSRELMEDEVIRGLQELVESAPGALDALGGVGQLLDAIERNGWAKAVPAMQRRLVDWRGTQGKLLLGACLATFEDYSGVPYAASVAKCHLEARMRNWALGWVLHDTLPLEDLSAMRKVEGHSMVLETLARIIDERTMAEANYERLFGHSIVTAADDDLRDASKNHDELMSVVRAELFRRAQNPK